MLGDGYTFDTDRSFGAPDKKFSINFSKEKIKFCSSLYYNHDNSYLFLNGKEIYKFKADNKNVNIQTQFSLGSISNKSELEEVSLKGSYRQI